MLETIFTTLWFLTLFSVFRLMRIFGVSASIFTLPSLTLTFFILYQYLGLIFFYWDFNNINLPLMNNKETVIYLWFVITYTLLGLLAGIAIFRFIIGKVKTFNEITYGLSTAPVLRSKSLLLSLFLLIFSAVIFTLYIQQIGFQRLALTAVLAGTSADLSFLRSEMGNNFSGSYHWYSIGMRSLAIFGYLIIFLRYIRTQQKSLFFHLFFGTITIYLFFSLFSALEKGPLSQFIVAIYLCYIVSKKRGVHNIRNILILFFMIFLIFNTFIMLAYPQTSTFDSFMVLIRRLLLGQLTTAYWYLELFPNKIPFLYGMSFPNPGSVLPHDPVSIGKLISSIVYPELTQRGIVGSAPTAFWGEMYANFGIVGVLLFPVLVGFLLCSINNLLIGSSKLSDWRIVLIVLISLRYKSLSETGLFAFIFDLEVITALVIFLLFSYFVNSGLVTLKRLPH